MPFITRTEALQNLNAQVAAGIPIVGCGAGTGISAKCAEAGGADLIIIYNSGRYRMAGRGSMAGLMPYGDANAIVVEMAAEVLPVVKKTPVQAGVCGTDPFRLMPVFLKQLKEMGFTGVQNFPTVGLYDGNFRVNLEATGMGYSLEVDMIRAAHELDLLTTPYVFNPAEAKAMAEAGADMLVAHVGTTTGGSIGAGWALSMDEAIGRVMAMAEAGRQVRSDIIVICHGGPFDEPEAVGQALARMPGIAGFFGASSIERLPAERAITAQVKGFQGVETGVDTIDPKGFRKPCGSALPPRHAQGGRKARAFPGDDKQHVAVFDQPRRAGLRRGHLVDIPPAPDEPFQPKDPILAPEIRVGVAERDQPAPPIDARHDAVVAVVAFFPVLVFLPILKEALPLHPCRAAVAAHHGDQVLGARVILVPQTDTRAQPRHRAGKLVNPGAVRCDRRRHVGQFGQAFLIRGHTALTQQHLQHGRAAVILGNLADARQRERFTAAVQGRRFGGHVLSSSWRVCGRI